MKRILSLALAFAMLLTCTAFTAASAESSDTLVVLPYMTSENLNPYAGFGIDKVVRTQLFNSLWQYDENGQGVACLAESWEDSEDGTSVTVHLRQDVTFSDGHALQCGRGGVHLWHCGQQRGAGLYHPERDLQGGEGGRLHRGAVQGGSLCFRGGVLRGVSAHRFSHRVSGRIPRASPPTPSVPARMCWITSTARPTMCT